MSDEVRFAVIGCGGMGETVHTPNLTAINGVRIAAYCDIDRAKAEKLLDKYGGDYITEDVDKILADNSIDAVAIQVGPQLHAQLVQQAARAGKHVFVEKPLGLQLDDVLETVRVVEESGIKFIYGTCCRLAPTVQMAKRMCPQPLYSYCQCVDTVTHQSCHNLDLAVNLFHESTLVRVYASGGQYWGIDPHLPADSFSAILSFEDGSTHTYIQHGNAYNPALTKYHYQLFGRDECVYLAERFKKCHYSRAGSWDIDRSWAFDGSDWDRGPFGYMGHYDELVELVRHIRGGQGNGTMTVRDAAYIMVVEQAILGSLVAHEVIDFEQYLKDRNADWLK